MNDQGFVHPDFYDTVPRAVHRRVMVKKLMSQGVSRVTAIKRAKELIK